MSERTIDKTHLSIDMAEQRGIIHRDYIAHCLRWTHVAKYLQNKYQDARVLDIGCGKELPFAKTLYSNRFIPESYLGIDVNRINMESFNFGKMADKMNILERKDICQVDFSLLKPFNLITCFEVVEHVLPEKSLAILKQIHSALDDAGVAFISTPNYNGKAAANHINEMSYEAMILLLAAAGLHPEVVYGTFASQKDIEKVLDPHEKIVYERSKAYFDVTMLANLFAYRYPEHSRNCLYKVRRMTPEERFKWSNCEKKETLERLLFSSEPHFSSNKTNELLKVFEMLDLGELVC